LRDELEIDIELLDLRKNSFAVKQENNLFLSFVRRNYTNVLVSFSIYILTFSLFYLVSKKAFYFDIVYFEYSGYFLFSLIIGALLSRKFSIEKQDTAQQILKKLYVSSFISLITLVIIFLFVEINPVTRLYIISAMFSGLVIESYLSMILKNKEKSNTRFVEQIKLSIEFIFLDGLILTFFCYVEIILNLNQVNFLEKEFVLLALIYLSWVISAGTTHKFIPNLVSTSRLNAFELQVKFYFQIIALIVLSMIFLQLESSSATYFLRALAGYSLLSSLLTAILFAGKIKNKSDEPTVVFLKAYEMKDYVATSNGRNGNGKYSYNSFEQTETESREYHKLKFEYVKEYGEVFSVLNTMLDLKSFNTRRSLIIKSDDPYPISNCKPDSHQLVVNLHVLNDQIKLNDYLLEVRKTLVHGGVFIGALLPHHYRYRKYLKKYSFLMANILYFFDFFWKRVMPKLPISREIYSAFSKEKDRAISLAEGLGRLVYCGFKVIDLAAVDDVVYFAAVKNGRFNPVKKFFYSPIFKMKRVGKDGKLIYVYKLRTMYPYSEFIQDFVYNHNKLEDGGKFKNDFRVPAWGRLFRKLWIDELPMLINWFRRDLKFVGVRPISDHYLSLYSEEHQKRRKNFKPGLVPPFYADMPNSIKEIELSEKRYLDAYEKNPIKTDIKYFMRAVNNILVKKKRSA
jgi:lipopolysaccharide/colanic/teichoic acid biosynthesis glycosyltransferase